MRTHSPSRSDIHLPGNLSNYLESSGSVQTFTAPVDGWYSINCLAAKGGNGGNVTLPLNYSNGGSSYGEFHVKALTKLYIYVGQASQGNRGGWNGGAGVMLHLPEYEVFEYNQSGGGGATDVRYIADPTPNQYLNTSSINSRIIVAGGGGGAEDYESGGGTTHGGDGGGFVGGNGNGILVGNEGRGATQTFGYAKGQGGPGTFADAGCGGGGYWGGFGASNDGAGGGGSGYISGDPHCIRLYGWDGTNSRSILGGHHWSQHGGNGYCQIFLLRRD